MATAILNEPVVTGNPVIPVVSVEFHGFKIPTVTHEGKPHFAIKPICEAIGLDFSGQLRNIKKDPVLGPTMVNLTTVAEDGKRREMAFLPVRFFNGWIFKVDANRYVKRTIREALITYQREGYDVMCAYFNRGLAVNPRVLEDAPAGPVCTTLSTSSRLSIQNLIAAKVSHYPSNLRPKAFKEAWSRVKNKFRVAKYEEIPEAVYPDAVAYILAMEMRTALPQGKAQKALPSATQPLSTIRDYASIFRGLPDKLDYWSNLSRRLVRAHDAFLDELDAIKKDALRPFRENRRIEVATLLDFATVDGYKRMFGIAEDSQHTAYNGAYGALVGLESLHELLVRG